MQIQLNGEPQPLDGEVTVPEMARDALAVIDAVGAEQVSELGQFTTAALGLTV